RSRGGRDHRCRSAGDDPRSRCRRPFHLRRARQRTELMADPNAQPRPTAGPLKIFLIATEESGDRLGASLMRALRRANRDALQFSGIGGREMAAEGLTSLYPIGDMAFMGITAILRQAPTIWRRIRATANAVI